LFDITVLKNWHEAANLFPLLPEEGLTSLAQDIKANSLQNPIVLFEDKVLDGRNRALACKLAGVEPTFIHWQPKGLLPYVWVISQNLRRRQLTASQLAVIAWELKGLFAAKGKKNKTKAGSDLPILVKVNSTEEAAEMVGASKGYVIEIEKLHKYDPSLIPQIKAGTIDIQEAKKAPKADKDAVIRADAKKSAEAARGTATIYHEDYLILLHRGSVAE
jgi:hypothetical protein